MVPGGLYFDVIKIQRYKLLKIFCIYTFFQKEVCRILLTGLVNENKVEEAFVV
jgi:hypothetical protein